MKNQKLLAITLLLSFTLAFFNSCSKDEDSPSFPNAEQDILSTSWVITEATPSGDEVSLIALSLIAVFAPDMEYVFFSDGTYANDAGALTGTGDWEISTDGTVLTLNKGESHEEVFSIIAISESGMTWVKNFNEEGVHGNITYKLEPAI